MVFLIFIVTVLPTNLVNSHLLTSETINSFVSDAITFWNFSTPVIFLNNEVSAFKLWHKLSDLSVALLIFNALTCDRIEYVRRTYHEPMKLLVIGNKNYILNAFSKILEFKILNLKITVILFCLDCNGVMFIDFKTADILGSVIFAHPSNESSVILYSSYYSYSVRGLRSVYMGQWNMDQRSFQINSSFPSKNYCFKDAILTTLTSEVLPWSPNYTDYTGSSSPIGFCGEIFKLLSENLNFRFKVFRSKFGFNYGELAENGSFTGVIGEFIKNNFDIGIGVYSQTINREQFVDFTVPISYSEMVFAAHMSTKLGSKYWSSTPLSVWLILGSLILLTTIAIKLSFKYEIKEDFATDWLPNTMAAWFQQGGIGSPKRYSSRIIYLTMCGIFWLLVCLFSSLLVSLLSMDPSLTMMTTLTDLAKSDYTIGLTEGASSQEIILSSNDPKMKLLKKRFVMKRNIDEGANAVCKQRRYAHLGGLTSFYNRLQQENSTCEYYFIKESLGKDFYHFVTQNDNVLRYRLSLGITRLRTSGILARLENYYKVEKRSFIKEAFTIINNSDQVRVDQLLIPFGLLIGGNCSAIIVLVCEIILFKYRNRIKSKYKINNNSNSLS